MTVFRKGLKNNLETALLLAELSRLAFKTPIEITTEVFDYGFNQSLFFQDETTSTEGFICCDDWNIVIVFRGSQQSTDWKRNFQLGFERLLVGNAHEGFVGNYNAIRERLDMLLDAFKSQKDPLGNHKCIFVTGHSLGAAMATVAASELCYSHEIAGVYPFSSPRVFSKSAASTYDVLLKDITYRFVVAGDMVTRVPKPWQGYRHIGQLHYFDIKGRLLNSPSLWIQFRERIKDSITEFTQGEMFDFEDHSIDKLISMISERIGRAD